MLRVGVIGLGMIGRIHLAAWAKVAGAKVAAVCDIDPKRLAGDFADVWGNLPGGAESLARDVRRAADWRDLPAAGDLDVIDICTPTPLHEEMAVAALAAGRHAVCEKPLARTADAADRIAAAAAKAAAFLLPAMCLRFWPQWRWLADAARDRRFGRLLGATFRRVGSPPPGWFRDGRQSGGAALDLHLHDTDFIRFAFGQPRGVFSRGRTLHTGCVDHLVTQYLYGRDGPVVVAEGSWAAAEGFGFRMQYAAHFEHASAEYDLARAEPLRLYRAGRAEAVDCPPGDGYEAELRYFADCIAAGHAPSMVTAADAAASVRLVEAELRSIDTGTVTATQP